MASFFFNRFVKLGVKIENEDEEWEYTEEPHTSRRQDILKRYPEIKKLMGYDPFIAYIVLAEFIVQVCLCWLVQDFNWSTVIILSYIVGGSLNHSLGSAIHEIGHNLAFGHKRPLWNRALGIFANLPMGIPISVSYKKYHSDHHRYLGHEDKDVDIPTHWESFLFRNPLTKMLWLLIHPVTHGIRPFYKNPKPVTTLEIVNTVLQLAFNYAIYRVFGAKALVYLVVGTLFALGFHPLAGHFISEHYLFDNGSQATHSYYGPLNAVLFNVGYHVEHHDFPYIPYRKLPQVRNIAKEFYEPLHYHTSWLKVLWDFIFDPDMGPQARGLGFKKTDIDEFKNLKSMQSENNNRNGHVRIANGKHSKAE